MLIIPAIDLQAGRCVRLVQGDFSQETVYGEDPVTVALRWRESGAKLVHVVDLDGARAGWPVQLDIVREIAQVLPVQMGGGLRSSADIERAIEVGVERVVLGTAALDTDLVAALVPLYGERLVVALDTRDGFVVVRGWIEESGWTMLDLAGDLIGAGIPRFLHTDVARDGTLTTPNYESLGALVALGTPVIASGGVASLEQITQLKEIGVEAAIVGRALYEGTVDLQEAMTVAG